MIQSVRRPLSSSILVPDAICQLEKRLKTSPGARLSKKFSELLSRRENPATLLITTKRLIKRSVIQRTPKASVVETTNANRK
ncbi:hypothetical protein D3C78_1535180 [compost metagenome]